MSVVQFVRFACIFFSHPSVRVCVCVCVCVCEREREREREAYCSPPRPPDPDPHHPNLTLSLNVIVSKFSLIQSICNSFYSSFYRHALIQKFSGANFTVFPYRVLIDFQQLCYSNLEFKLGNATLGWHAALRLYQDIRQLSLSTS